MSLAHDPLEPVPQAPRNRALEADDDLRWLIADHRGRRIILRLLEQTAPFTTSYSNDANAMALLEGRKQLGYFLLRELTGAAPEQMSRMLVNFTQGKTE